VRGDILDGGIWPETLYESHNKKETNLSSKNSSGVTKKFGRHDNFVSSI
jgi:hypothetical protein